MSDEHAPLKELIARHTRYMDQRDGLQARLDRLDKKITAVRAEIDAEDTRVNGPR